MKKMSLSLLVATCMLLEVVSAANAANYRLTEIVHPPATQAWRPLCGVNDKGEVAAYYYSLTDYKYHAYRWSNGVMTPLPLLPGAESSMAIAINNQGKIAGYFDNFTACLWVNDVITPLGSLFGDGPALAQGINDLDQVVGWSRTETGANHAFRWQNGSMIDLNTLGGTHSEAWDINLAGQIVGQAQTGEFSHAFLWENGSMIDLDTLSARHSAALSINDAKQVVGWYHDESIQQRAFIWQNGVMSDLGTLGGSSAYANAINNAGQVVGRSASASWYSLACLWENGEIIDLNTRIPPSPGITLEEAGAINEKGQIVCFGRDTNKKPNDQYCAWLLTPISSATPAINFLLLLED